MSKNREQEAIIQENHQLAREDVVRNSFGQIEAALESEGSIVQSEHRRNQSIEGDLSPEPDTAIE